MRTHAFKLAGMLLAVLLAAPGLYAAGDGPQDSVLHFSANLLFWKYLAFALIVAVLGWKVIPIMLKQLEKRSNRIQEALDKADQVRAEAEVLLKKHEEMLRNAHQDAKKITDQAAAAAREGAAQIRAEAEQAAKDIRQRAEREVDQLTRKAESELRQQAVELALLASSRVLERALTGEDHRRLAEEAIAGAGSMRN
jgi:F-type H+-transporting ATPase subunit b